MERRTKPDGGFRFIGAYELLWVYFAFSAGLIRWYDLRVWFACQEAVARRCCARNGIPRRYFEEEIQKLVGGVEVADVQSSLRRLQGARLLGWSGKGIAFAKAPNEIRTEDLSGFWMMVEDLGQPNRKVPMPRRTIRLIASGTRKVLTATILGHVLRCCYIRRGEYSCEGSCSASWIARLFGINERNIKTARKQLFGFGLLSPAKADAWHRQRYGGRAIVNPNWSQAAKTERSPRNGTLSPKRSPLLILKGNSFGSRNQKPALAADRPPGVCESAGRSRKQPTWKHVELDDLRDPDRTLTLFDDAVNRKLVSRSEADRLNVMAAAQRALKVATLNACGLFVTLVRCKLWHHITLDEEDAAREGLKRLAERGVLGSLASQRLPNDQQAEKSTFVDRRTSNVGECECERMRIRELIELSLASTREAFRVVE